MNRKDWLSGKKKPEPQEAKNPCKDIEMPSIHVEGTPARNVIHGVPDHQEGTPARGTRIGDSINGIFGIPTDTPDGTGDYIGILSNENASATSTLPMGIDEGGQMFVKTKTPEPYTLVEKTFHFVIMLFYVVFLHFSLRDIISVEVAQFSCSLIMLAILFLCGEAERKPIIDTVGTGHRQPRQESLLVKI